LKGLETASQHLQLSCVGKGESEWVTEVRISMIVFVHSKSTMNGRYILYTYQQFFIMVKVFKMPIQFSLPLSLPER
jgi:hypothetical protein